MNRQNIRSGAAAIAALIVAACSSSSNPPPANPPVNNSVPVTVSGVVSDGPVTGGTLYAFTAAQVIAAMQAVDGAADRAAALAAAGPAGLANRSAADGDTYSLQVGASIEGQALFLVFDNAGAEDEAFGDTPPNLEAVAIGAGSGSNQRVNVSMHTTLIAQIVRAGLDTDGDGNPTTAAEIAAAIQAAELSVLDLFGADDQGEDLFDGENPTDTADTELLHAASSVLGLHVRTLAALEAQDLDAIIAALGADASDGALDGLVGADFDPELEALAGAAADFLARDDDEDFGMFAVGPCSSSAVSLRRACSVDIVDDLFEGRAICADISDADERAECIADLAVEEVETAEECDDVFDARLELCEALDDAAHEPAFGFMHAANFVDPRDIGAGVTPNPYLPLVPGTQWIYAGDFLDDEGELISETITVTVLDRIKLIDGIPCLVVNDVVVSSDGAMEDTNDWFAQDVDGNVWYCGEISRDFELFDGDDPEEFELVHTEGSWKHGRDGAKAGMLIPAAPEVGDVIRQEVLYGEAEDVIAIESITGTESSPAGSCSGDCLVTLDYTPLEPGAEENKYYAPGIGMIVEIDLESGDRVELMEFNPPAP